MRAGLLRVAGQLLRPSETQHDPLLVHHDAYVPPCLLGSFAHVAHPIIEPARGDVLASHVSRPGQPGQRALRRHPGRQPVRLSRLVVVDLAESQALEPPRGSRADVSGRVPAVHDDRPIGIEPVPGLLVDSADRDADGARKVLLLILLARQHLDQLRTLGQPPLHPVPADPLGHGSDSAPHAIALEVSRRKSSRTWPGWAAMSATRYALATLPSGSMR